MGDEELTDEQVRHAAEKRVNEVLGFRTHLMTFLIVNAMLFLIWLIIALTAHGDAWFPWFLFPLVGWGIGIAFHAYGVYGSGGSAEKRNAMVDKEMEKIKQGQP